MKILTKPRSFLLAAALISGCALGSISLPVVGKLSSGETAQGNVIIDLSTMVGQFDITTLNGFTCSGTYKADAGRSTITIPVTCNNGQRGKVIATRDGTGMAGTANARLENGMTGKFLFGNVDAQAQADFLKN